MLNKLLKVLVDLVAGTKRIRRNFERKNPNEKVLAADAGKGIMTSTDQNIQRGLDWATAQRAVIMLTDQNIICGKWTIPLVNVSTAQLIKINSTFGSAQILKIQTTDDKNYQFGMQINPEWTTQNRLPLKLEKGKITNTPLSLIVRVLAVGYILYVIYDEFIAR